MKFVKVLSFAAAFCAVLSFTSACGMFEDDSSSDLSAYWTPDDGSAANAAANAKNAKGANAGMEDGALDLNPQSAQEGEGPGSWDSNVVDPSANAPYAEGFGPRIQGVEFKPVYFLFDQNLILATEESKLMTVADYLKAHADAGVVIEGNCDERGTTEYNRALGEKRAIAAKTFLLEQGIDESRIKTISYGKERPAQSGSDESAFKLNRRDELVPVYLLKK